MRIFFLLFLLTSYIGTYSQKPKTPITNNPVPFGKTITIDDLKKHLYVIAGADMEGRETATEGQRKAAAYIENQFRSMGLAPGNKENYQMQYPVFQDSLVSATLEVNGKRFELNKDFSVNMGSAYNATMMSSEIVFVGYGFSDSTRDDYSGINTRGK